MALPRDYQIDLPIGGRPSNVTIPEMWYPGVQNYWSNCTSGRNIGDHIQGIKAVVIHATAGASSSGAVSVMNGSPAASFHWLVPDEDEPQHGQNIWSCVRERDAAWHVRNTKHHPQVNNNRTQVNHWSLGIEVVNRQNGGDSFSDWQVAVTAQIVRYCWSKYPNLRHIISHARLDPTRRDDPGANFPWERFEHLILNSDADPLETLTINDSEEDTETMLDSFKTATEEDENRNYEIEEKGSSELDKLHESKKNN